MTKQTKCRECGRETGECQYLGDWGATYQCWDVYSFKCSSCGYSSQEDVYGGDSIWDDHPTDCPFCGKQYCGTDEDVEEKERYHKLQESIRQAREQSSHKNG